MIRNPYLATVAIRVKPDVAPTDKVALHLYEQALICEVIQALNRYYYGE